ncbi:MAG: tRNA preQ1(34) S-adenosylmethionine ribosyltransferase-isomerase QueA [Beijerinckiaceae bacterium]|nr:tRNA preQ1(34) S-adenosylmethionine ribosyltransferase-isomerase QueA [Beijerinckiaceae bacterium]
MKLSDFDFELPEDRIALHPVSPRDSARMLVVRPGGQPPLADSRFSELPEALDPGDLLVFNNTRVLPTRLLGRRIRGENSVAIEALLVRRLDEASWEGFAKPGKRLAPGDRVAFGTANPACQQGSLEGEVIAKGEEGLVTFRFDLSGPALDEALAVVGAMPLPPYILEARRRLGDTADADDRTDYQTIFAERDGAVAAPTASLHFTPSLMAGLAARGIEHCFVTLHVGAGTFLPVKTENLDQHRMHAEWGEITPTARDRIRAAKAAGKRVVAVGTTACRLLESAGRTGTIETWLGETDIFIRPGFRFRVIDGLITNFHLPKSTLLMLVSAFAGFDTMRAAYAHAIASGYRFYSYGDGSLLFPART